MCADPYFKIRDLIHEFPAQTGLPGTWLVQPQLRALRSPHSLTPLQPCPTLHPEMAQILGTLCLSTLNDPRVSISSLFGNSPSQLALEASPSARRSQPLTPAGDLSSSNKLCAGKPSHQPLGTAPKVRASTSECAPEGLPGEKHSQGSGYGLCGVYFGCRLFWGSLPLSQFVLESLSLDKRPPDRGRLARVKTLNKRKQNA